MEVGGGDYESKMIKHTVLPANASQMEALSGESMWSAAAFSTTGYILAAPRHVSAFSSYIPTDKHIHFSRPPSIYL